MPSTWPRVRLVDLCEVHVDCVNRTAPVVDGPTPYKMIRTTNVRRGFVDVEGVKYVTQPVYEKWTRRLVPRRGDVLLTREAPLGEVGMLRSDETVFLGQRIYHFRANEAVADKHFLLYALQAPDLQGQIRGYGSGSTVEHMRLPDILELMVAVPALDVQRRIGGVLKAYDDLIENCERRIRVLDEMARALYREWFVSFRYPGHEKTPLVDSPLGRIPKGWESKAVAELIESHIGGGWGSDTQDEEHTTPGWVIRGTDIPDARYGRVSSVPFRHHLPSNIRSRALEPLDIVFETSGGSKGQPVGRTLLVTQDLLTAFAGPCICASFCKKVRPLSAAFDPFLLYLSFLEGYSSGETATYQVQSTGISNFKWSDYIASVHRAVSPPPLQLRFREIVEPWFTVISKLGRLASNLRHVRDLLLPRLLSGQLSVDDAA